MFCALHDQLASLGRHAQLTHCFSAVAELLVYRKGVKTKLLSMKQTYSAVVNMFVVSGVFMQLDSIMLVL